jgi:hypothetical protein
MNREEIIRMAREAGFSEWAVRTPQDLERFAALVAVAEREECARVAAWILKMPENDVSAAIRGRGMK